MFLCLVKLDVISNSVSFFIIIMDNNLCFDRIKSKQWHSVFLKVNLQIFLFVFSLITKLNVILLALNQS